MRARPSVLQLTRELPGHVLSFRKEFVFETGEQVAWGRIRDVMEHHGYEVMMPEDRDAVIYAREGASGLLQRFNPANWSAFLEVSIFTSSDDVTFVWLALYVDAGRRWTLTRERAYWEQFLAKIVCHVRG